MRGLSLMRCVKKAHKEKYMYQTKTILLASLLLFPLSALSQTYEQLGLVYKDFGNGYWTSPTDTKLLGRSANNASTDIVIPFSTRGGLLVSFIGDYAFENNALTSVIIPDALRFLTSSYPNQTKKG